MLPCSKMPSRTQLVFACAAILLASASAALSGSLKLADNGIEINGGSMGIFRLGAPTLRVGEQNRKPSEQRIVGDELRLKYAGNLTVTVKIEKGNTIAYRFAGDKAQLRNFRLDDFHIPPNYIDGGSWRIGNGASKPFPKQKPPKPHLFQGNASDFELRSVNGEIIRLSIPEHSYQQLQDNREWNWKIFAWWCQIPYNKDWPVHTVTVGFDSGDAKSVVLVDRFGQTTRKDFPGKISSEKELQADVKTEKAYYASLKPLDTDKWGGVPGTRAEFGLKPTGFFHVEKHGDRWILVAPSGNAFFHLGICSFGFTEDYTYITGREKNYEWLPPHQGRFGVAWIPDKWWNPHAISFHKANVIRKYGTFDADEWGGRMVDRIRRMGFNSIGAFSGSPVFKEKGIPHVGQLPLGKWQLRTMIPGVRGVFDPFDEEVLKKLDELLAKSLAPRTDEPLLIGYFLENEQAMEDIPRAIPKLDGTHACKRRLVQMLEKKYKTADAFNQAWGTEATTFEQLKNQGLPVTTKAAFDDMHAYLELFLHAYYKTVADSFHKYDPNHMLIGNRWQPGTANNETLCRVAGAYLDVVSINYYTDRIDEKFIRRIHEWSGGKPQFWSEFYYTCEKESNVSGSGRDVDTQQLRGQAYRQYVEGAASLGFVVGVEWFTLIDQAVTGRFFEKYNGERNNTGIFNVLDRPYKPLVSEMATTHRNLYDVWLRGRKPFVLDHPRFRAKGTATRTVGAGRVTAPLAIDGMGNGWPGRPPTRIPGDRLVTGRESHGVEASFKASWDNTNLYLLVAVVDDTPMLNKRSGNSLWNADAVELFIGSEKLEKGGAFLFTDRQILVGAGKPNQVYVANIAKQPEIRSAVVPAADGKGYTMEVSIPWTALGVKPQVGQEFLFDMAIDDSATGTGRRSQLMWNGIARNSSDRGAWGRLRLER